MTARVYLAAAADVSDCGKYRYLLTRRWSDGARVALFVMLNPSTADAAADDPTIRKCVGFAMRWRCAALEVVNLFALRATDPRVLRKEPDPVGPDNRSALFNALARASRPNSGPVVCAWGAYKHRSEVSARFAERALEANVPLHCLRKTKTGDPWHPLYVPYDIELQLWP